LSTGEIVVKIAVLTRNYKAHLDDAMKNAEKSMTFYSNVPWTSVKNAHSSGTEVVVYFVVPEHAGLVSYRGTLVGIQSPPVKGSDYLEKLLERAPDDAARDEVVKGKARTVYQVSQITKVSPAFFQSELLKRSDGMAVSADYGRGYCIVHPYD
jgi:hypothetical protein